MDSFAKTLEKAPAPLGAAELELMSHEDVAKSIDDEENDCLEQLFDEFDSDVPSAAQSEGRRYRISSAIKESKMPIQIVTSPSHTPDSQLDRPPTDESIAVVSKLLTEVLPSLMVKGTRTPSLLIKALEANVDFFAKQLCVTERQAQARIKLLQLALQRKQVPKETVADLLIKVSAEDWPSERGVYRFSFEGAQTDKAEFQSASYTGVTHQTFDVRIGAQHLSASKRTLAPLKPLNIQLELAAAGGWSRVEIGFLWLYPAGMEQQLKNLPPKLANKRVFTLMSVLEMINIRLLDLTCPKENLPLNVTSGGEQLWDESFVSMSKWLSVEVRACISQGREALCSLAAALPRGLVHYCRSETVIKSLLPPSRLVGIQLGVIQQHNTDGSLDPLCSVLHALNSSARRGGFRSAEVHVYAKGRENPAFALGETVVNGVKMVAHAHKASYSNGTTADGKSVNAQAGGRAAALANELVRKGLYHRTEEQKRKNREHHLRKVKRLKALQESSDPADQKKAKDTIEKTRKAHLEYRLKKKAGGVNATALH